jgi:hypothetical protein
MRPDPWLATLGWVALRLRGMALLVSLLVLAPLASAHKGSDAYLATNTDATTQRMQLRLSIALKDLDQVLALDSNADGQLTWGEVRAAAPAVQDYLAQGMAWRADGTDCAARWMADGLERRSDGSYWIARAELACDASPVRLDYRLMQGADSSHRLLLSGDWLGQPLLATLAPGDTLALGSASASGAQQTPAQTVASHVAIGAAHLLEGYDHLAFLLALVLPMSLPLWRRRASPATVASQASDWGRMLSTVTAFTVGHSVTLGLVAWGVLKVSSDWVEPLIVLSIGVSALLNLYPVRWLRTEVLAGGFGLVHGMGFAGLLLDAQAPVALLPWALLGFNLGIEAAQLLVLFAWVLVCQPLLSAAWYPTRVVRGLSWGLAAFSLILLPRFADWY